LRDQFPVFQTVTNDTLCTGGNYQGGGLGGVPPVDCEGTITDTEMHMECTGSMPLEDEPACTANYVITIDWTRTGDTVSGEQVINTTPEGDCSEPDPVCIRLVMTGTRIDPNPGACIGTPVEGPTWGVLKSTYR
jgi:hypothetical protein